MTHRHSNRPLGVEVLENRDCPTVTFGFQAGVLRVTGDNGPNSIAIFQPRDRVVDVVGDGAHRTFEGVNEVIIVAQGGNDAIHSSKPKEIVVVGSKIKIHAGAGNDTVTIDDGGPSETPAIFNAAYHVSADLGTGVDKLNIQMHHHDDVNLNLTAADDSDYILIGLLVPAVQKIRDAAIRTTIDLAGGGNTITFNAENYDVIDLALKTLKSSPVNRSSAGNTVNVGLARYPLHLHTLWNLDLNLGKTNDIVNVNAQAGKHTDFLWSPTVFISSMRLGAGNDKLNLMTAGLSEVKTAINTGPIGNGRDQVSMKHDALRQTTPVHQARHLLDGGRDIVDFLAIGYQMQMKKTANSISHSLFS